MERIIAIANKKGGTGKTTTSVNLASGLAIFKNKKTLLIDTDSQASATVSLGFLPTITPSLTELISGKISIDSVIYKTQIKNLFLIPASTNLSKMEPILFYKANGEFILKKFISKIKNDFDFIIIDCPPTLNMMGLNALISATEIIIPLKKEFLPMEATNQFFNILLKIINKKNPNLKIDGILFTEVKEDNINSFSQESIYFGPISIKKLKTEIRYDKNLAESPKYGQPIFLFSPSSKGSIDYKNLVEEIISLYP